MSEELAKQEDVKVSVKEIIKGSNGELVMLADFNDTAEMLTELADKHKGMVITEENLQAGKDARLEIREHRYGLQNITKHNKSVLTQAKKKIEGDTEELISIINPVEEELDKQIKDIENKKKLEKEAKEKAEKERVDGINEKIKNFRERLERKVAIGNSKGDHLEFINILTELENEKTTFDEFEFEGDELLDEYRPKGQTIMDRVQEKLDLEKKQKEQEQKEQEQKENDDALKKEKEKILKDKLDACNEILSNDGWVINENGEYTKEGVIVCKRSELEEISLMGLMNKCKDGNEEIADNKAKKAEEERLAKENEQKQKEQSEKREKYRESVRTQFEEPFKNLVNLIDSAISESEIALSDDENVLESFNDFCTDVSASIKKFQGSLHIPDDDKN